MNTSGEPFDRTLPSPLLALTALRAFGEDSVVATGHQSERQKAMYVRTGLDDDLLRRMADPGSLRLLILSGSAGGGKSALIRSLKNGLPAGTFAHVLEDATHADSPTQNQTDTLAGALAGFQDGVPSQLSVIAANTGLLLQLRGEFEARTELALAEVAAFALHKLGVPPSPRIAGDRMAQLEASVLVIDLDQRPTSGGPKMLLRRMMAALDPDAPDNVVGGAVRCGTCTVREWCAPRTNMELLADPCVGEVLDSAVEQVALARGRDIAPRQLWDGLAELALGGLDTAGDPCEAVAAIAANQDRLAVWSGLLPNGALAQHAEDQSHHSAGGRVRASLASELATLDPSYYPAPDTHDIIAQTGIDARADGVLLASLIGRPDRRHAIVTAVEALADPHGSDSFNGRGLVRAHWLAGKLAHRPTVSEDFRQAVAMDDDAVLRVLEEVADGLVKTFGALMAGDSYLPTDSLGESPKVRVLVGVRVIDELDLKVTRPKVANREGSDIVGQRPLVARLKIGSSYVDFDYPLYQLLQLAADGALPATVSIERFHALRHACERLGRGAADDLDRALLVRTRDGDSAYRVTRRKVRGHAQLQIDKVA